MAQLQFKMGLHAGLENANIKAGTVYVTTDEKAMYVDINDSTRIRLGDIIQVDTVNKLRDMAPDYDTNALYYVIDENALLKYTGNGVTHSWKQLNSVSDITTNLDTLNTKVGALETAKTAIEGRLDTAEGDIDALEGKVTAAEGDIDALEGEVAALKAADTRIEGKADANTGEINSLKTKVGGLETTVGGQGTRLTEAEGKITTLVSDLDAAEALLGTYDDTSLNQTAFGRIKALETTSGEHTTAIGTLSTDLDTAEGKIGALETKMTTAEGKIKDNADAIAANAEAIEEINAAIGTGSGEGTLTGRLASLESDMTTAKGDIDAVEATVASHTTTIGEHTTAIEKNKTDIATLNGTVAGHTTSITNLQTAITGEGGLDARITANTNAISAANTTIAGNTSDITSLKTRVGNAETAITKLNGKADEEGSVDYKVDQARIDLEKKITDSIKAANAMDYKGTVSSKAELDAKTDVKVGDTYVVASAFGDYTEGDLLVANGNETNGVITANLEWQHVPTGYRQAHNPALIGADNAIELKALQGAGNSLGKINFVTPVDDKGDPTTSATVAVAGNTVTIGMEWGTF